MKIRFVHEKAAELYNRLPGRPRDIMADPDYPRVYVQEAAVYAASCARPVLATVLRELAQHSQWL